MLANILFKKVFLLLALAAGVSTVKTNNAPPETAKQKKVLVFAKTNGYHHESIAEGMIAIQKLGLEK